MSKNPLEQALGASDMSLPILILEQRKALTAVCNSLRRLVVAGDSGMLEQWVKARNDAIIALRMYTPTVGPLPALTEEVRP